MKRALLAPLLLAIAAGCAPKRKVEHLTLEPVIIHVGSDGASAESPDPELDRLADLQEKGDCTQAIPGLERFVEDFPESKRYPEAVYRLGLCEEESEHVERARGYYLWVAAHTRADAHAQASLRAAFCLETLGHPREAADEYAALVDRRDASAEAKAGARLRQAICLFHAAKPRTAARVLDDGIARFGSLASPEDALRATAAEARFGAAEERAREYERAKIAFPKIRIADWQANRGLRKSAARKLHLLRVAQDAFTDVIALKDAEWAAGALFRIGEMDEEFADALVAAPAVLGVAPELRAKYVERVAEQAKPFRQQAFEAYVRIVTLGERVGLDSPWVDKARERVKTLEPQLQREVIGVEPGDAGPDGASPDDASPEDAAPSAMPTPSATPEAAPDGAAPVDPAPE